MSVSNRKIYESDPNIPIHERQFYSFFTKTSQVDVHNVIAHRSTKTNFQLNIVFDRLINYSNNDAPGKVIVYIHNSIRFTIFNLYTRNIKQVPLEL